MARVIPLAGRGRASARAGHPAGPRTPTGEAALRRAVRVLERRAGEQALLYPSRLGRAAARAEALLAVPPARVDSAILAPSDAIERAERILRAASVLDLVAEEVAVLAEALSCDLVELPLDGLERVADSVMALGTAPPALAAWADPPSAEAAETVLEATADELRSAKQIHDRMYDRFTEEVWQVPGALLQAGQHRWRVLSRLRLRARLRDASRSGRVPGRLGTAAREVLAVRAARDRLHSLAPLLARHLGVLGGGPLADVDVALTAVRAVRGLQAALGRQLDVERLGDLIEADAFRSHDVSGPAANLRNAIRAWSSEVEAAGGGEPGVLPLGALWRWAGECSAALPVLAAGEEARLSMGGPADPTMRALVDALVLREHVEDLIDLDLAREKAPS